MPLKPICIDLCCGLGGWTEGFLAEGYECIGYDTEAHDYGNGGYPGTLIIADITTLHGSAFKDATIIVASPPCQRYSYMAMPWSLGKAKAAAIEADATGQSKRDLNLLFDTCFRLQNEACETANRYIPMIVENVRGAVRWVGPSKWNYGSYYLWGDVPALMPTRATRAEKSTPGPCKRLPVAGGGRISGWPHKDDAVKIHNVLGCDPGWFGEYQKQKEALAVGTKQGGDWFGANCPTSMSRMYSSKSIQRKKASAEIAKIPFPLSQHIARTFKP